MIDPHAFLAGHGIDLGWLRGELLRRLCVGTELVDFEATAIGTGQVGENLRLRLAWAPGADETTPHTVIIKLPSDSPISRATVAATRTYIREVGFYGDLRPDVDFRTP